MTSRDLVEQLPVVIPEFAGVAADHLEYFGEWLPHLLLGELAPFMQEAREIGRQELVQRILDFAEHALRTGDDYVQNAIEVSFVENTGPWEPALRDFITTWPPALREAARGMGWPPRSD